MEEIDSIQVGDGHRQYCEVCTTCKLFQLERLALIKEGEPDGHLTIQRSKFYLHQIMEPFTVESWDEWDSLAIGVYTPTVRVERFFNVRDIKELMILGADVTFTAQWLRKEWRVVGN